MKHISELKDIGTGKRCLIVGGGHSVNDYDFDNVPKDVTIICTNQHMSEIADIIIYYDKDIMNYWNNHKCSARHLIGFKNNSLNHCSDNCTHYYAYQDMIFGDTGFHSLQFADKIMGFSEIYLIGFDYCVFENSYHYDELESDPAKLEKFKAHSIDQVASMYDKIDWKADIYNMSFYSTLTAFTYSNLTKR